MYAVDLNINLMGRMWFHRVQLAFGGDKTRFHNARYRTTVA